MKEQIISFKTAELAREKGFFGWCNTGYGLKKKTIALIGSPNCEFIKKGRGILAPTQALLQKWLRRKKIDVFVAPVIPECKEYGVTIYSLWYNKEENIGFYKSYEEALEKGLYKALKLI